MATHSSVVAWRIPGTGTQDKTQLMCWKAGASLSPQKLLIITPGVKRGAIAQSPGREAALAWASLAQRFPASSVLAREGALSPNSTGGLTPFRPLSGLQEIPVATREENCGTTERKTGNPDTLGGRLRSER